MTILHYSEILGSDTIAKTGNKAIKTDYIFGLAPLADLLDEQQTDSVVHLLMDLRIELLSCRYQRMSGPNIVAWPRRLPDTLLYLPVEGALQVRVGGRQGRLEPGDLLIVPDSVPHGLTCLDADVGSAAFALHLQLSALPGRAQLDLAAMAITRLPEPGTVHTRMALLTHLLSTEPKAGRTYADQVLKQLLIDQVLTGAPIRGGFEPVDPRITETMAVIAQHPGHAFTVAELAERQGLSPSRFRTLFREATGMSPKQYLIQHRLGQVRRLLLRHPDMTIDQIAATTEFQNGPQLHKAFRQAYGITPAAFRRRAED